jgi:tetratricopeptide (TPR) repeat protein
LLSKTAQRNNQGIEYEKKGKIEEAIKVYEENIIYGYPATHSFNRLMILYHKQKQYSEEIRVIKRAIEIFSTKDNYVDYVNKWKNRLDKVLKK